MKNQIEVLRRLYRNRWANKKNYDHNLLSEENREHLKTLRKEGIVIIPGFLTSQQAETIRLSVQNKLNEIADSEWEEIIEKVKLPENKFGVTTEDGTRCWSDARKSDQRCFHAELLSSDIASFAHNNDFSSIASELLERKIGLLGCMANRTRFVEGNLGSGGGWHRDMSYRNGFKALVYLVDVTDKNGCFQYIPKSSKASHHLLKTPTPDKYQYTDEDVYKMTGGKPSAIFDVTGKAGTLVLFDTNGVHRGKPIEQGERYALTNYYKDNV